MAWAWRLALSLALGGCYHGVAPADGDTEAGTGATDGMPDDDGASGASDSGDDGTDEGNGIPAQPLHRLNRLEYNNTVRDLLGTDLRPANTFGPDPEANGFDNMADQLGLSPGLLDSYAKAAQAVIADAIDERPVFSVRVASAALGVPGGYPVGDLWALTGNAAAIDVNLPQDGDLQIVLTAGAATIGPAPVPTAAVEVDGLAIANFTVEGNAPTPIDHVFPITLAAGLHTVRVVPTNWINDAVANTSNNILVASLAVQSIALTQGPGHARVYVCEPQDGLPGTCESDIIENFASRAWRRPVTASELASLLALRTTVLGNGESADDALRIVLRAVMTSPKFFYRARTFADVDTEDWLDDYVLASRLSYFLWSSMPDDRLFAAAKDGVLATDEGLSDAVAWMLQDEKAQALMDGFGEQWLSTRHLGTATPSPEVYPEFDEDLRQSMTQEAKRFFGDFLASGSPVASMVLPDFAYRNDRLAMHYGEPLVGSPDLVRVAAGGAQRRGLLSLGAWLTARSDAEHSSPIRRGLWVSDRLLCTPVPPPPAGLVIEPLEFGGVDTVREQLEKHRSDPSCASCHALLDVLGIGFEEYDGIGRQAIGVEVDNLGELPDGRTFEGGAELAALYANSDVFVGCLTQKLYAYALGRPVRPFDAPSLQEVSAMVAAQGGDLPALVDAIVHTPAFRSPATLDSGP